MTTTTGKARPHPTDRMLRRVLSSETEAVQQVFIMAVFRVHAILADLTGKTPRQLMAQTLREFRKEMREGKP